MTALIAMLLTAAVLPLLLVGRVAGTGFRQGDSARQLLSACLMGVVAGLMARYAGPVLAGWLCGLAATAWLEAAIYAVVAAGLCCEVARLWALDYAIAASPRDGRPPSSIRFSVAVGVGFAECQIAATLLQATERLTMPLATEAVAHCWSIIFLSELMGYYHDLSRFVARKPYRGMALAVPLVLHSLIALCLPYIPLALKSVSAEPSAWSGIPAIAVMSAISFAAAAAMARVLQAKSNKKLVGNALESSGS